MSDRLTWRKNPKPYKASNSLPNYLFIKHIKIDIYAIYVYIYLFILYIILYSLLEPSMVNY